MAGYTTTGVLEDCEIPLQCYPLQTNRLTLLENCQRICKPFGINVVVDASVQEKANQKITKTTASESQSAKDYLAELCASRQILLSHTNKGELLLTQANTKQDPIYYFNGPSKGFAFTLDINGQGMHSEIGALRQARKRAGGGTIGQTVINNPYVSVFRTAVKKQTSGDNNADTNTTARNILSDELKSIVLTIEIEDFYLNGLFVKPGQLISITNPELYIFSPTSFFIESVKYKQNSNENTATLTCYLPEVYNNETPKNIFL